MSDEVLVGMASIPERVGAMEQAVAALAPQADRIAISLNDYTEIPSFLSQYPNVEAILRPTNGGDAEKFAAVDEWDGYVVTVDDDILYPPDYVQSLIDGIEKYGRQTAVGHHGGKTLGWNGSAVAASHKRVRCLHEQAEDDTDCNVLGTGAMAYHAGGVPVYRDVFRYGNMADVQMACHARTMGVPFVGLAHEAGWLKDICPPLGQGRRIYNSNKSRDGSACDTVELRHQEIKRFDWRTPQPSRPKVRISIATHNRPEKLAELLSDIVRESRWVDVEVAVYEDPSDADYASAHRTCARRHWRWQKMTKPLGRKDHWRLVDKELHDARRSRADWFLFLPDDVRLVRHAIPRAIATWHRLEEPATLTLWRLKSLEGLANWTGQAPIQRPDATESFHVDGLYLCRRETLESLGYACPRPPLTFELSSGVGRGISRKLHALGARMYRVDSSLALSNDDGVSLMNPDARRLHPAVTL